MPITLGAGVREKKIYWTWEAFDTWETKTDGSDCSLSWYFWHFKPAIDTTGKVSLTCLFLLDKKENSFWFYFSPITWQALMANAFFIPPEYWPLHSILVGILRLKTSQTWFLNEHKIRLQDPPVPDMNTAFWGDLQVFCCIRTITHLLYTWIQTLKTIRVAMQQIIFYKYSVWVQVVFCTWY